MSKINISKKAQGNVVLAGVANSIISFETFRELGNYNINSMKSDEPSCFNSRVSIEKFRITK